VTVQRRNLGQGQDQGAYCGANLPAFNLLRWQWHRL